MNSFLANFFCSFEQVFQTHSEEARNIFRLFVELLEELRRFMSSVSTVYNDSANLMNDILCELKIVKELQRFDGDSLRQIKPSIQILYNVIEASKNENNVILSEMINSKEKVEDEQECLEHDKPKFDRCYGKGNGIRSLFLYIINEVKRLVNARRIQRFDNLSESLQNFNSGIEELLKMTNDFYRSIEKSLTDLENYTLSVNRLFRCSFSEENNYRIVLLASFMVPETEELQDSFKKLREQALKNIKELENPLIRIKPRILIKN